MLKSPEELRKAAKAARAAAFLEGQAMATKSETDYSASKSAARAQRLEIQAQKKDARAQKAKESDRPEKAGLLCMFPRVDVRKSDEGYQFFVRGEERLWKFALTPQEVGPILKDLESAILVVRSQM